MKPETPERKKSWDKEPISKCEWRENRAKLQAVMDEDSEGLRQVLKNKIAGIVGRHPNPLTHSVKMAAYLIQRGFLIKPDWHEKSTLTLEFFAAEDLAEAYAKLKKSAAVVIDGDNPF
jgi:tRNA splicing endonuclease